MPVVSAGATWVIGKSSFSTLLPAARFSTSIRRIIASSLRSRERNSLPEGRRLLLRLSPQLPMQPSPLRKERPPPVHEPLRHYGACTFFLDPDS